MRSVNRVTILGNVGRSPDIKYTQKGNPVANFSVATTSWSSTKQAEITKWIPCVAYKKTAEVIRDYVGKGSRIFAEGAVDVQSWTDRKTGDNRIKVQVVINNVVLLDTRNNDSAGQQEELSPLQDDDIPF